MSFIGTVYGADFDRWQRGELTDAQLCEIARDNRAFERRLKKLSAQLQREKA